MMSLALAALALAASPGGPGDPPARSSGWLARLPDGETKRKFLLDCTGCHQFDEHIARPGGRPRTEAEWVEAVTRMLGYGGATGSFPVIAADRDPEATAAWLTRHLPAGPVADPVVPPAAKATITEYPMPEPQDLPHDVVVEPDGRVLVTGMFTHVLYRVDPAGGAPTEIPIPVEKANPRAIDRDTLGRVWAVLGAPKKLAMLAPDSTWRVHDVGMYPHSLAIAPDGRLWVNGHFTRDPELIGAVDPASGKFETHEVPPHPTMAKSAGGPIPYEIRAAPDGRIWQSELHGNRMAVFDPATGRFRTYTLPTPHSGPRRFDVDAKGIVWIPAYATGRLVRLDPASGRFAEIPLPLPDALPYVVRADPRDGSLWIGTGAADVVFRYDPRTRRFETFPLGTRGAMVRHLAIDRARNAVWLAYGASPGIPARIARLVPTGSP
jgi:virginiamycin B lyase